MNSELKPSRYAGRSSTDQSLIRKVLDEARFCTVAYVKGGRPYQLPTGFVRNEDRLMIHGSVKSQFLEDILAAGEVCFSAMLFDGLVLADTAFDHSVNYRSIVVFSNVEEVTDPKQKQLLLEAFTDKYIPGRMKDLPPPTQDELKVTRVLSLGLSHASLKMRNGGSGISNGTVWTGVVPASVSYGIPEANGSGAEVPVPDYLTHMIVKSNV